MKKSIIKWNKPSKLRMLIWEVYFFCRECLLCFIVGSGVIRIPAHTIGFGDSESSNDRMWEKGGRKVGEARQSPPFPQASYGKDGKRVVERREKPGNPPPRLHTRKAGKGWPKDGKYLNNLSNSLSKTSIYCIWSCNKWPAFFTDEVLPWAK